MLMHLLTYVSIIVARLSSEKRSPLGCAFCTFSSVFRGYGYLIYRGGMRMAPSMRTHWPLK